MSTAITLRAVVEPLATTIKTMMKGTIKTLTDRGFGFISREGEAKDLFFHSKELQGVAFDELKVGDQVTFDVVDGEKGPAATNVSRA
jgi:cold shock protein